MDLGIAGRVALVTAGSKGLGRASAVALAREGVKLAICARGADALADAEAELAAITACPGLHDTERMKQLDLGPGPQGDPADFGCVVAFLCSEQAKFVSGTAVVVDGARSLGLL